MTKFSSAALLACLATPLVAEDARQLDAHEHGVGQLDIAIEGTEIAMELHAPGADIVGFEYEAESAVDRGAVDAAVAILARPLDLFLLSDAAACSVVRASAGLESEADHDDHAEDDHDEHGHEEHAEDKHDDHDEHGHEEHAADEHDDHDEHAHEEHAEDNSSHTEFHAEYLLSCANPEALGEITFAYFETFPNALELEVQVISENGAAAFEVERDAPKLDLSAMF